MSCRQTLRTLLFNNGQKSYARGNLPNDGLNLGMDLFFGFVLLCCRPAIWTKADNQNKCCIWNVLFMEIMEC